MSFTQWTTRAVGLVAAVGLATACADHRVPMPTGAPGAPRVGWVIMHGDRDNPNEQFACQSSPRSDCAIPASRLDRQTFSEVHLYFHPTPTETKYSGVVQIGFFRGTELAQQVNPVVTVKPGDVGNNSVVGIVTDRPGPQTLRIEISAVTASGVEEQIREQVPVIVE